jgi:pSer/pThr/pTyr-binding forkhead associated (FHA) protein
MAASLVPTEGGSPITLDKPIVLIGRHQECDITLLTSSKVSRRHCCIVQVEERFVLRDLGSMNGIRINGHRVVETELCPGDEVAVADICFIFQRDDVAKRAGKPVRGVAARPPADDVSGDIPVVRSREPQSDDERDSYEPSRGMDDEIAGIREKDDSHSEEHGFVSV